MTQFQKALSDPQSHFKRLQSAEPSLRDNQVMVCRTHSTIETKIEWNNRLYLLSLPLHRDAIQHIENLEDEAQKRRGCILIESIILYDEITLTDSLGRKCSYDMVVQDISCGVPLSEAVHIYKHSELHQAIKRMKEQLDAIGFSHNNLQPSNILISKNGSAHPIRYWYAEWGDSSDNDTRHLTSFINHHSHPDDDFTKQSFLSPTTEPKGCESTSHEGISCVYKYGHYGFVDSDHKAITRFEFSWASDFQEGRAIVAKGNKIGVINQRGARVLPVIFDNVEFDIETGFFRATKNKYLYLIDYDGNVVKREFTTRNEEATHQCRLPHFDLCNIPSKK